MPRQIQGFPDSAIRFTEAGAWSDEGGRHDYIAVALADFQAFSLERSRGRAPLIILMDVLSSTVKGINDG
ncbi:hypothetical protein DSL72_002052 [Monilinia vaccinii-corymbosi]|uniref:Uncharacterized protein n=1 Tax=Monilinia vaccinii-corymbosi TaxID=61207 RepID=A0A8A3PBN6_9HELO|nr:hypothetical protein DSL72_002052 [Monilinia vaccinii-corymbosi]